MLRAVKFHLLSSIKLRKIYWYLTIVAQRLVTPGYRSVDRMLLAATNQVGMTANFFA